MGGDGGGQGRLARERDGRQRRRDQHLRPRWRLDPASNPLHQHITQVCTIEAGRFTHDQVIASLNAGQVYQTLGGGRYARIRPVHYCPTVGCFEPYITTDADGYAPNYLDNLLPAKGAVTLRAMAQHNGASAERDAEVTFRFPVHPIAEDEWQALAHAIRGPGYRFVRVEDTLVRNLGAGAGAGPYVIIDFVVPVVQHAGGDLWAIAALAGLKNALGALRRAHPQRILQVRVGRRRPVAYHLTGDIDVDAALDAISSDYQRLPRGAKDREWVDGRWIELTGSQWQTEGDAPEGLLLPAVRAVADFLRHWLFICSWFERRLRARPSHALRLALVEVEMLGWLLGFIAAWLLEPRLGRFNGFVLALGGQRMANILGYSLYSVLFPATTAGMTAFASIRRTVLMNLVNFLTAWAVFALAYRNVIAGASKTFANTNAAEITKPVRVPELVHPPDARERLPTQERSRPGIGRGRVGPWPGHPRCDPRGGAGQSQNGVARRLTAVDDSGLSMCLFARRPRRHARVDRHDVFDDLPWFSGARV